MNKTDFDKLRSQLHTRAGQVLAQKRGAYASEWDVLANFKQLAAESALSEIKVWEVLMRKALNAMVRTANGEDLGGEPAIERFVDFANYVDLGWALANQADTICTRPGKTWKLDQYDPNENCCAVPHCTFPVDNGNFCEHHTSLPFMTPARAGNRIID